MIEKNSKGKFLDSMSRDEVQDALNDYPVVILPMGATEQHGKHMPLGVDIYLATYLAGRVSAQTGAVVTPTLPFGYSWVWRDIPGTISLPQDHVEMLIKDVAHSVSRYGTKLLVLIGGHDANNASMKYATRELMDELDMKVIYLFYPGMVNVMDEVLDSPTWNGMIHACEFETSLMLAVRQELVDMSRAVREYPEIPALYGRSTIQLENLSNSGSFGDPTQASVEKGQKMLEIFSDKMVSLVQQAFAEAQEEV